ncbi:MAG: type II toxin-antitoxin system VapC family toxin [Nanoarchaeota archaeon]
MQGKQSTKTGTIGIDTSFLIDFLQGDPVATELMHKYVRLLRVSELVVYEFLCGNLSEKHQELFLDAIQSFQSLPFNRESAVIGSHLYRGGKKKGNTFGHQDCMIAGSYLSHGVSRIITRDRSFVGVDVISY